MGVSLGGEPMNTTPGTQTFQRMIRLAALPTAPRMARVFVVQTAKEWMLPEDCIDTVELLTSELVTNAVKETGRVDGPTIPKPTEHVTVVCIWVRVVGDVLRVEVWDSDTTQPIQKPLSPDAESGRGLFLVESLSRRWGCYSPKGPGKVVWCEIGLSPDGTRRTASASTHGPLPRRKTSAPTAPRPSARSAVVEMALLERVLWGLQRLGTASANQLFQSSSVPG